ncbi:MAG: 5'/3'-nucleotidase SurE [Dehalococcoidia bacterium]|nr:5'/3'-nucleotidase SurE [Dehalococcoidia bacterium]
MSDSPTVLVTNDDGIESAGLWALVRAVMQSAGRVVVVAPEENQSAVGSGFTLRRELNWKRYEAEGMPAVEAWTVDGTPADCVTIAMDKILDEEAIELVVSGINQGANVGQDVLASGTVGGAMAGHWRGKPAIAYSMAMEEPSADRDWSAAERVATDITRAQLAGDLPGGLLLNVNVPHQSYDNIAGILATRMGRHGYVRLKQRGEGSAMLERQYDVHTDPVTAPGTDIWALAHRYISVSPLHSNLTNHQLVDQLAERLNATFA